MEHPALIHLLVQFFFPQIPTTIIIISGHGAQNTKSRTFFNGCMHMGNMSEKWNMDSTLGFPLQSLPYNLESITRQQKFAHISSRTVNKNVKLTWGVSMSNSQDEQGGPSRSSGGSVTPSRRPHRLPDNLNRELEMRKLGPGYS